MEGNCRTSSNTLSIECVRKGWCYVPGLRTDVVWTKRYYANGGKNVILRYGLCRDQTRCGNQFLYLKIHQEIWQGPSLLNEDLQVVGGFGSNHEQAERLYQMICASESPVSPQHLADIVHDFLLDNSSSEYVGTAAGTAVRANVQQA